MAEGPAAALTQPAIHGSVTVVRDLAASPDVVYAAYGVAAVRRRWFRMPGDPARGFHELDFRVGGHEAAAGVFAPTGEREETLGYRSTFWDLAAGSRIAFSYSFTLDGITRWASLVTVELSPLPSGDGTRLRHTEQYAYLTYAGDGAQDVAHLRGSLNLQLNGLAAALGAAPPGLSSHLSLAPPGQPAENRGGSGARVGSWHA
jgi:uncharacterized protein YndB with AHSA1/START domain